MSAARTGHPQSFPAWPSPVRIPRHSIDSAPEAVRNINSPVRRYRHISEHRGAAGFQIKAPNYLAIPWINRQQRRLAIILLREAGEAGHGRRSHPHQLARVKGNRILSGPIGVGIVLTGTATGGSVTGNTITGGYSGYGIDMCGQGTASGFAVTGNTIVDTPGFGLRKPASGNTTAPNTYYVDGATPVVVGC